MALLNKVLFVTYHFPPSGSAKTRRTLKFLKYLCQFSWHPVVLTANEYRIFNFDSSLLQEVPKEVPVYRTNDLPLFSQRVNSSEKKEQAEKATGIKNFVKQLKVKSFKLLKQWIIIPDEFITWLPFAFFRGINVIHKEGVEVIYSTAPPFSNHLIALLLKKYTRKPLAIDFRDAWVANPARQRKYARVRRAMESLLERVMIRGADLVIATTEGITQDFRTRYPHESAGKFITIPNGYDREEFDETPEPINACSKKMCMVHTGYLSMERSPKPVLEALRRLLNERPLLENGIEVYFIGESGGFLDGKKVEDYIKQYSLDPVVKVMGHVPRREATQYQMHAHILLLIIGVVPKEQVFTYGIASKVFDYMMAKKRVLAISDKGPVSELVEKTRIGDVLEPLDIEGIKQYLSISYDAYANNGLRVNADMEEIRKYDVRLLSERLAELFSACRRRMNVKEV
jgi:glycosyltransferase involved in cell wall biosynthesis